MNMNVMVNSLGTSSIEIQPFPRFINITHFSARAFLHRPTRRMNASGKNMFQLFFLTLVPWNCLNTHNMLHFRLELQLTQHTEWKEISLAGGMGYREAHPEVISVSSCYTTFPLFFLMVETCLLYLKEGIYFHSKTGTSDQITTMSVAGGQMAIQSGKQRKFKVINNN
ncbi:hypothetical protein ACJX0J_008108, partial [Zea mays]